MQQLDSDSDSNSHSDSNIDSDSDSDNLVQRHSRTSTEVLVVMMTSHYFLGKCCDIQWAI